MLQILFSKFLQSCWNRLSSSIWYTYYKTKKSILWRDGAFCVFDSYDSLYLFSIHHVFFVGHYQQSFNKNLEMVPKKKEKIAKEVPSISPRKNQGSRNVKIQVDQTKHIVWRWSYKWDQCNFKHWSNSEFKGKIQSYSDHWVRNSKRMKSWQSKSKWKIDWNSLKRLAKSSQIDG